MQVDYWNKSKKIALFLHFKTKTTILEHLYKKKAVEVDIVHAGSYHHCYFPVVYANACTGYCP